MKRVPVASTNLSAVAYDPTTRTLEITFTNQRIYRYEEVPPYVHEALLNSESVGKTFFSLVRGKYEAVEVTEPVQSVIQGERPEGNAS